MYIGIDIGGMSVKGGVVDADGKIIFKKVIVTQPEKPDREIVEDIAALINSLISESGEKDIKGVGVGCPGSVYDEKGVVRYCCNINFRNTPMADMLRDMTGIDTVRVSNDANCAALGETLFGAGCGAKNSVMVTLGTGVGTGIVVDGKLLTGYMSAGAEGGHMQISTGRTLCGCKKRGHYEAFASATALIAQANEAASKHPDSLLFKLAEKDGMSGKTPFIAAKQGDKVAKAVVNRYLKFVGIGLVNFANIFFPEVIIVGGGISNEGDAVIRPLERFVRKNVYGAEYNPPIKVVAATLKNDAGIIGAAALNM